MEQQLFRAVVTVGPRGRAVFVVPFDPGRTWGTKADHPVGGTIGGKQVRGRLMPSEDGWVLTITPMWLRDSGVAVGDHVTSSWLRKARNAMNSPTISLRHSP